jgi:hypothetical protein
VSPQYIPQHFLDVFACRFRQLCDASGSPVSLGRANNCGVTRRRNTNRNGYAINPQTMIQMMNVALLVSVAEGNAVGGDGSENLLK